MNIKVITSFNQEYYNTIGKESLESWLKYWPSHMDITVYVEDFTLPQQKRVKQVPFSALGEEYQRFQDREVNVKQEQRFSKKAFSFIHAMFNARNIDRIVWLDADVITQKKVPFDLLLKIMPDTVLSTHLGVTYEACKEGLIQGNWLVPETGFFAINRRHQKFGIFREEYFRRYREYDTSGLRRFLDNDVYGAAIRHTNAICNDLCAPLGKPYKTPMKHTVLGDYLFHYKAKHSKFYYQTADCQ